jgi:hypothetical protein
MMMVSLAGTSINLNTPEASAHNFVIMEDSPKISLGSGEPRLRPLDNRTCVSISVKFSLVITV